MQEQLERARFFVALAKEQPRAEAAYRLRLAAVYCCRAIADHMLDAAEKRDAKRLAEPQPGSARRKLEEALSTSLPYCELLEQIRDYDSRRFGIAPPNPAVRSMVIDGSVRVSAKDGTAAVRITSAGVEVVATGDSTVSVPTPLLNDSGSFYDNRSSRYVTLEEILEAFLEKAPAAILAFEKSVS